MAYSYPIWNDVTACIYKSSKSYGAKDTSEASVKVGTSANNSKLLVRHCTTRRKKGDYVVFTFYVDIDDGKGFQPIRRKWMHTKTKEWFDAEPEEIKQAA